MGGERKEKWGENGLNGMKKGKNEGREKKKKKEMKMKRKNEGREKRLRGHAIFGV